MRIVGGSGVSLGGLDLLGVDEFGVSWNVNAIEDWDAPPGNTAEVVQNQFADGGHLIPGYMEPKTVRLVGRLVAPDRPAARAAIYRLTRLLPSVEPAVVAVSEDGSVTHRWMKLEGAPKIPRPTDVYASFDLLLTSPDSRLLSGDGTAPYQHQQTAFLPSTSGGLQVRGAEVLRTNLATNPSFEAGATGWSFWAGSGGGSASAAVVTTGGKFGANFYRMTRTVSATSQSGGVYYSGFNSGSQLTPDTEYPASVWVRCSKAQSVELITSWKTSTGAAVSAGSGGVVVLTPNVWTELTSSYAAPPTAVRAELTIYGAAGGVPWLSGDTLDVDGLLFGSPSPYFDGSTAATASRTYAWTGAANDSASTESSVGGLQVPFSIGASVVNGSVTVTATGDAPPPVLVRINGPAVQPIIRDELGGSMPLDISLDAGQWLDVDLDNRTIKINSAVSRRNLLRGRWITPRAGMVLSLDAAVYDPATSMTVFWTDASY